MIPVYVFDDKYVADTDGFTFNMASWLGDADSLAGSPSAAITPSGTTLQNVSTSGSLVTVWVSGGTAGITYTIELEVRTAAGRDCRVRGTFTVEA